ncbi:MAG TPA: type II toxin-antitoxin system prevent-host-death family antitoxin [Candidatus Sulfotelmatobacter sp.]|jgi:prevent-host-death family protein|nr:type II toxin-antitoxin system prevent-host-death family antitoxin [Candidatus Sulfotelmatobacter sp.]
MRSVGLFQAKNELSALVERVRKGEEIMITRRGQEAAILVPASRRSRRAARDVVEHIREARKGARMPSGYTLRKLVEEGRRF